jgi:hypothetical protein
MYYQLRNREAILSFKRLCQRTGTNWVICFNVSILSVRAAARSKAWVYGRSPAAIVGSNPTGGMDVCYVLSGGGLCGELVTRPEESYRLQRVVVRDQESW